jgi:hypothetical protein
MRRVRLRFARYTNRRDTVNTTLAHPADCDCEQCLAILDMVHDLMRDCCAVERYSERDERFDTPEPCPAPPCPDDDVPL